MKLLTRPKGEHIPAEVRSIPAFEIGRDGLWHMPEFDRRAEPRERSQWFWDDDEELP